MFVRKILLSILLFVCLMACTKKNETDGSPLSRKENSNQKSLSVKIKPKRTKPSQETKIDSIKHSESNHNQQNISGVSQSRTARISGASPLGHICGN